MIMLHYLLLHSTLVVAQLASWRHWLVLPVLSLHRVTVTKQRNGKSKTDATVSFWILRGTVVNCH